MKCMHRNCCRNVHAKGYCHTHYIQFNKYRATRDILVKNNEYYEVIGIKIIHKKTYVTCIIDKKDLEKINKYKWHFNGKYVASNKKLIHRVIMNAKNGEVVDHINGDVLDNRRENLRICSIKENTRNHKIYSTNTSGFTGVYKEGNKWRARIRVDNRMLSLGVFVNIEDAVKARKEAEEKYFGEFRRSDDLSIR